MVDDARLESGTPAGGTNFACRTTVDGLVVGGREVWWLVARSVDDLVDLLGSDSADDDDRIVVCREIAADGTLTLGAADPEQDPLLSAMLMGDDRDRA